MPDQKTVYVTDDGDAVMLSVYVASTPADLSCGKLYAGKFTQTSAENCALHQNYHCGCKIKILLRIQTVSRAYGLLLHSQHI